MRDTLRRGRFMAVKRMPRCWMCDGPEEFELHHPSASEKPWVDIGAAWAEHPRPQTSGPLLLNANNKDVREALLLSSRAQSSTALAGTGLVPPFHGVVRSLLWWLAPHLRPRFVVCRPVGRALFVCPLFVYGSS